MFIKGMQSHRVSFKKATSKSTLRKELKLGIKHVIGLIKSFKRFLKERNYVYFQEYIDECEMNYRIIFLCKTKAFGLLRDNRNNDFRAYGSGKFGISQEK